mgnify:FL=1
MFDAVIDDVQHRGKRLTVYSGDDTTALDERFGSTGITIDHRTLPRHGPATFVTVRDGESFLGTLSLADFEELLAPPVVRPARREDISAGYRVLFDLLDDTVFRSLDRRQLLGASREIEDRAFRVGHGTLRASFQQFSAFDAQVDVYRHLARETALDIHIYGEDDWTPPDITGVTYHESTAPSVKRFWILAFDGGGNRSQVCALLAREREDEYTGF